MILLLPFAALLLVSCSVFSSKNIDKNFNSLQWNIHKQKLSNLNQFQIRGLLIYSYDKKKSMLIFFWNQIDKTHYSLILTNFLGNTILKLSVKPDFIQLNNSQKKVITDINIEKIINDITGISIPFDNLQQWILGLPGSATKYKINNQHLLSEVFYTQNDKIWKIIYNNYDNKIQVALPTNIKIIESNQSIILKINKWIIK